MRINQAIELVHYGQARQIFRAHRQARRFFVAASWVLLLWLLPAAPCTAQSAPAEQNAILRQAPGGIGVAGPPPDIGTIEQNEKQVKALNVMRQKSMVSDADKLLRLVKEFNDEIVATSPAELSPDLLQKLATIEKLARSVKQKMGTPVVGAQPSVFSPMRNVP
jgi:hypothetical protein